MWFNAQTDEWEPWRLDTDKNQWVPIDRDDDVEDDGNQSRDVQPPAVQRRPQLSEDETRLVGLLAEGLPDKQIACELGKPGLDVNMMTLLLCGKLGVKSKAELMQRASEMGLLALEVRS